MHIKVVEKEIKVTLPPDKIGMVMMQPFIELENTPPYKWKDEKKNNQIIAIKRVLEISKQKTHEMEKTHFTIFPEYSIPGLDGIKEIDKFVKDSSWDNGTIVIGGIDALTKDEFQDLINQPNIEIEESNKPEKLGLREWVNCILIWFKDDDGNIKRFVQLKCFKSLPEDHLPCGNLFEGKAVYLFKCKRAEYDFRFLSLVCFDLIGQINSKNMIIHLLENIETLFNFSNIEMDMIFILQNNDKPNHDKFLEAVRDFFLKPNVCQGVIRTNTILALINTAGGIKPGDYNKFGYSSLIYSKNIPYYLSNCEQTYATHTMKFRLSQTLKDCKDTCFREKGACIHSLSLLLPQNLTLDVLGRSKHLECKVHPIEESFGDKRVPNEEVPATIKWLYDKLDTEFNSSCNSLTTKSEFESDIDSNHKELIKELKEFDNFRISEFVEYAIFDILSYFKGNNSILPSNIFYDRIIKNGSIQFMVDQWDIQEIEVVKNTLYLLSIIMLCFKLTLKNSLYHGLIDCRGQLYNLLCVEYVSDMKKLFTLDLTNGTSKVIVFAKTNYQIQNILHNSNNKMKSDITNPYSNVTFVDPGDIYNIYNEVVNKTELKSRFLKHINYEC